MSSCSLRPGLSISFFKAQWYVLVLFELKLLFLNSEACYVLIAFN